ncbi:unnamed protein product [Camellia sinensis]
MLSTVWRERERERERENSIYLVIEEEKSCWKRKRAKGKAMD